MSTTEDRDASSASSEPPGPEHDPRPRGDEHRERGFVSRQASRSGRWAATTAASTVLAAALISGAGATAAVADAPASALPEGVQTPRIQDSDAEVLEAADAAYERRTAAVAAELSEAVAHGEVTREQADAFLTKMLPRMAGV